MVFRSGQVERNELFLPGRMAYVVDLDDEFTDTDIPTTLIRSKADCPSMEVLKHLDLTAHVHLNTSASSSQAPAADDPAARRL